MAHPNAVDLPSKVFAAPDSEAEAAREKLLNAHMHGKRIADYPKAEKDFLLRMLTWEQTDEGRKEVAEAAAAKGRFVAPPGYVAASVTPRGQYVPKYGSNPIMHYGAERAKGTNPVDPLTAARMAWEAKNPGKTAHWSNSDVLSLETLPDGFQERSIAYNGKGQQIRFRDLVMTAEPTEVVLERREMERAAANDRMRQLAPIEAHKELVARQSGIVPKTVTDRFGQQVPLDGVRPAAQPA